MAGINSLKSLTEETQEERAEDIAYSINRTLIELSIAHLPLFRAKGLFGTNQVPLEEGKILVVQGDRSKKDLKLVSTMKMRRYLEKDCVEFLARVVDKGEKVRNIQDILIVRNHPEVFLENLAGLPSTRQVEFQD
ncbi:hypothetical protein Tco_0456042 [Tanacetum coccineum]